MGRTLHYAIRPNPLITLTENDWNRIDKITKFFNKSFKWTCENVGFSNLEFYPRWMKWFKDSRLPSDRNGWNFVNKFYANLEAKGLTRLQILRELHNRKLIAYHTDNDNLNLQDANGFTKVAGNEWNALLVTVWLMEVSKILPENEIELHDEGKFLKVDIIIRNGKARPNIDKLLEKIRWYSEKIDKGEYVDVYTKERDGVRVIFEEFKECAWQEVSYFCRPVDAADFNEHPRFTGVAIGVKDGKAIGDIGQILAGFHGEYYGFVSETEAKLRSQQSFNNIHKHIFQGKE